ncbi:MAG: hypothetical protein ACYSU3_20060 [Planctomycetota bacterium]
MKVIYLNKNVLWPISGPWSIEHLRTEAREKLSVFRPSTLAQASRISGVTPADITVLQVYLKKMRKT